MYKPQSNWKLQKVLDLFGLEVVAIPVSKETADSLHEQSYVKVTMRTLRKKKSFEDTSHYRCCRILGTCCTEEADVHIS